MKNKSRLIPLAAIAVVAVSGYVFAADLPKEGTYDYTVCFIRNSARIDYSKAQFAYSYEETGIAAGKIPGTLFDGETVRCVGMTASLDGKRTGGSLCEGVAKDGDKRLTRFWYDNDGKFQREQVRILPGHQNQGCRPRGFFCVYLLTALCRRHPEAGPKTPLFSDPRDL